MKPKSFRKLKMDELESRILDLRNQFFNTKIQHATGQLDNSASIRILRRELARALTVRAERSGEA